jgi:hypothetical protein
MRWTYVAQNWDAFHEAMAERWPHLEEDALMAVEGERAALERLLMEAGTDSRDDVAADIDEWLEGAVPADVRMDPHLDNAAISQSGRYVAPGENPSDDDAKFGDDGATGEAVKVTPEG